MGLPCEPWKRGATVVGPASPSLSHRSHAIKQAAQDRRAESALASGTALRYFPGMANTIDLNGRNAVVTGGAQGIGRAIVERLLDSGASVAIWDRDGKLAE